MKLRTRLIASAAGLALVMGTGLAVGFAGAGTDNGGVDALRAEWGPTPASAVPQTYEVIQVDGPGGSAAMRVETSVATTMEVTTAKVLFSEGGVSVFEGRGKTQGTHCVVADFQGQGGTEQLGCSPDEEFAARGVYFAERPAGGTLRGVFVAPIGATRVTINGKSAAVTNRVVAFLLPPNAAALEIVAEAPLGTIRHSVPLT